MSKVLDGFIPRARAAFAQYWVASAALLFIIVAAALIQFTRAPREYIATQQLQVVLLSSGSTNATNTTSDASSLAAALADPSVLSSPRLARDVLEGLPTDMADVSATALQGALSGSASASTFTLTAAWPSPHGADEILSAALTALQTEDALLPTSTANDSVRILPVAPASAATRSSAQTDALNQTLLQRILMALIAAVLLPFALDALLPARRTAAAPVTTR